MGFLGQLFTMAISAILIQNFVLSRFLGLCPYLGVSKKMDSAFGMGMAVIFVMTMASAFCYLIYQYLLVPFQLEYLQTLAFILTIAALVQFVEMVIKKNSPALYKSLGVYLPLITTNCAVLGVAILNITPLADGSRYSFIWAVLNGLFSGIGFTFVLLVLAGIRE
ncbi:MAG TPA: Rnf-Nqr domain containing protein, partial [Candidatus Cloacimonas sp.]|nr:Rnf-Nqr domain containing protein [Candidatus Cloacimonas sp.]